MENIWGEIRWDEIGDDITIDAWLTEDDNENGIVIATINIDTGEVTYFDDRAKKDHYAQEVIDQVHKIRLVEKVSNEIEEHVKSGDLTAIDELLHFVPRKNLIQFLPEKEWKRFK